jgi:hypothetical protein
LATAQEATTGASMTYVLIFIYLACSAYLILDGIQDDLPIWTILTVGLAWPLLIPAYVLVAAGFALLNLLLGE